MRPGALQNTQVKQLPNSHLNKWGYPDGTVFYLARTDAEVQGHKRGALGPYVWRRASGSDALYEDCVGPSAYWKAQGMPVRVWGLLTNSVLNITVLPAGECMNRWWRPAVYLLIVNPSGARRPSSVLWRAKLAAMGCVELIQSSPRSLRAGALNSRKEP